jgi:hypothetical protein
VSRREADDGQADEKDKNDNLQKNERLSIE